MLSNKFKVLIGVLLFVAAFGGLLVNQLILEKQVTNLTYQVQEQQLVEAAKTSRPTLSPTATPTATLKFQAVKKIVPLSPTTAK